MAISSYAQGKETAVGLLKEQLKVEGTTDRIY